ncbi:fumarylacetoacetate hydrolase family protein [Pseudaquabacterium rugosum]|uniref:Fumarylacetoacetate hydrolase family protein n=1 Tax=Pseudaquabacterium rugosum TaxID=2984194 RepID=A0ABU9BBH7_9BURK
MRFATLDDGSLDGRPVLVDRHHGRCVDIRPRADHLLQVLQRWDSLYGELQALQRQLDAGQAAQAFDFDPRLARAPLPRAPQWLDASAFLNHGRLMEQAFGTEPIPLFDTVPVMYQGASDDFLGPCQDVQLPDLAHGIDFEGEFGVITGEVPMGTPPEVALDHVRLLVQINDWSLRALGPHEMATGFGFLQAKPSTAFAPLALTPDELGDHWQDGRVHLNLAVQWNGERFGEPHGREMHFDFGRLIAHAARTRRLSAGSVVGSGTVSNVARSAGSACIAERRVIEKIDGGAIRTGFMRDGDRVRMEARAEGDGGRGPFGVIEQRVRVG